MKRKKRNEVSAGWCLIALTFLNLDVQQFTTMAPNTDQIMNQVVLYVVDLGK